MIRSMIMILLTAVTVGVGVVFVVSALTPVKTGYLQVSWAKNLWLDVRVDRGCVTIRRHRAPTAPTAQADFMGELLEPAPRRMFGLALSKNRVTLSRGPSLAGLVLLAAYPTIMFARGPLRRYRRRRRGLCAQCGYDLTGNVSGVCPECGTGPH